MKRILGRCGIDVSAMGLGCAAIGGPFLNKDGGINAYGHVTDSESIEAINAGLEAGITLFDTSNIYGCGRSERLLGSVLREYRDDVIIATKFGNTWDMKSDNPRIPCRQTGIDITTSGIKQACLESLERLQTDYIDIYQLHLGYLDRQFAPEVMETLENLVEEGLIRYYGWSTNFPESASIFAAGTHCTMTQFRHNIVSINDDMLGVLNTFNIAGFVKGPLGYGILTGKYNDDSTVPDNHLFSDVKFSEGSLKEIRNLLDSIHEVLTQDGRTLAQAAIGWIWAQHKLLIPIPGFKNVQQVEENSSAMQFGPLSKNQLHEIERILGEDTI